MPAPLVDAVLGPAVERHRDAGVRAAGSPRRCRSAATPRAAPPGSRCGSPGRRCRTRSGCRSRRPGWRAWPSSRGSRRPAGPGRRCRARRPAPARAGRPELEAEVAQGGAHGVVQAQVEQVVVERPAHQELERQVVDALGVVLVVALLRLDPAAHHPVAHRVGHGEVAIERVGRVLVLPLRVLQVVGEGPLQRVRRRSRCARWAGRARARAPAPPRPASGWSSSGAIVLLGRRPARSPGDRAARSRHHSRAPMRAQAAAPRRSVRPGAPEGQPGYPRSAGASSS